MISQMPQGLCVDNCSLRFCRKRRPLDLRESRSPTQLSQRNLQLVSRRFWAYAYIVGLGLTELPTVENSWVCVGKLHCTDNLDVQAALHANAVQ